MHTNYIGGHTYIVHNDDFQGVGSEISNNMYYF